VLPGEDKSTFERLRKTIHESLDPFGGLEIILVDRIVNTLWRLRRLERAETDLLNWRILELKVEQLSKAIGSYQAVKDDGCLLASWPLPKITVTDKIGHATVKKRLTSAHENRDGEALFLGRAFDVDASKADTLSRLSRYETTLERTFYRSLHELQRIQTARRSSQFVVPQAVDLDIAISSDK
jgi:hypothetical protein